MSSRSPDHVRDPDASRHEQMRRWRAAHPEATFTEIEAEANRHVAALRTELIQSGVEPEEPGTAPTCAACARTMHRAGIQRRTITTSHQEPVTIQDQRYRCPACGAGLFPPG